MYEAIWIGTCIVGFALLVVCVDRRACRSAGQFLGRSREPAPVDRVGLLRLAAWIVSMISAAGTGTYFISQLQAYQQWNLLVVLTLGLAALVVVTALAAAAIPDLLTYPQKWGRGRRRA